MRKWVLLFILLSFIAGYAQNDLTGMKFCIDPGHGNYPNTKPFETRINLRVAEFLKAYLTEYGATVILTRQDSISNPSLSDREYIANSNNVDFFLSIHHNAFQGNANYTVVFYEEKSNGQPEWAGQADVMCEIMANFLHKYLYTTNKYVRGDLSFLGFNLGVLNNLSMPGVLTEASFWDYVPEVHRLNALGYLNVEGFGLNHAYLDYYSVPKKITPFVEGLVEDLEGEKLRDIKVTLTNGVDTMVYVTDSQNIGITNADRAWGGFPQIYDVKNGLYFFENFPLGQAKVIFEGEGLVTDSVDIAVIARTSTRVSPVEMVYNIPPTIVSTTPVDRDSNVSAFNDVSIVFSRPMNRMATENAVQLIPEVNGSLSWKDNNKNLLFTPRTRFEFEQKYTFQISGEAMDNWGFYLDGNGDGVAGDAFSVNFRTVSLDTSRPIIIDFHPVKNDTGIFVNDIIRAEFNKRLDPASISGSQILLMGDNFRRISVSADYSEWENRGLVSIIPKDAMKPDMNYKLTIANAITDFQGNQMANHFQWNFNTQKQELVVFSIEDFETASPSGLTPLKWFLLTQSGSDSLTWSSERFAHGNQSMMINYHFETGSDSLSVIVDHASDTTWLKPGGIVSVNILGDNSGNYFKFIFEDEDGFEASEPIMVDWSGWKNVRFDLAHDSVMPWSTTKAGNGSLDSSIHISGLCLIEYDTSFGEIYFDDIEQLFVPSPSSVRSGDLTSNQSSQFRLFPNYPNPFNPHTTIAYDVPAGHVGHVQIKVFDIMGKEIKTLTNKAHHAGHYEIVWDGKDQRGTDVASGIYFYQLKTRDFQSTNKMLLIR